MPQDPVLTRKRLQELWEETQGAALDLAKEKKYAILSDLHLGDGGGADNFRYNENALQYALRSYLDDGYELILLGDVEEFWQFDLEKISARYGTTIYGSLRAFGNQKIHRIFGNHDKEWSDPQDPAKPEAVSPKRSSEALVLKRAGKPVALLVHGHQGSIESDKTSWFSRFFVKAYGQTLEPILDWLGLRQEKSATKSQVATDYERILYGWAKEQGVLLICGHSHRAIFASKSHLDSLKEEFRDRQVWVYANRSDKGKKAEMAENLKKLERLQQQIANEEKKSRAIDPLEHEPNKLRPFYFNTGCALYTDGITAIEIDDAEIRLVKWNNSGCKDPAFDKNKAMLDDLLN